MDVDVAVEDDRLAPGDAVDKVVARENAAGTRDDAASNPEVANPTDSNDGNS